MGPKVWLKNSTNIYYIKKNSGSEMISPWETKLYKPWIFPFVGQSVVGGERNENK